MLLRSYIFHTIIFSGLFTGCPMNHCDVSLRCISSNKKNIFKRYFLQKPFVTVSFAVSFAFHFDSEHSVWLCSFSMKFTRRTVIHWQQKRQLNSSLLPSTMNPFNTKWRSILLNLKLMAFGIGATNISYILYIICQGQWSPLHYGAIIIRPSADSPYNVSNANQWPSNCFPTLSLSLFLSLSL